MRRQPIGQYSSLDERGNSVLIFDRTLSADAANIDTGVIIPPDFRHLLIIVNVRTTEAVVESLAQIRFNGDSGANYDEQDNRVINTSFSGALTLLGTELNLRALGASAPSNRFTQHTMTIADYSKNAAYKNITGGYVSISGTAATCRTGNKSAIWHNTAAITRILLQAVSPSNLLAGTTITIFGLSQ
jgi:hypothetical protein